MPTETDQPSVRIMSALSLYIKEAGDHRILSFEEEREMFASGARQDFARHNARLVINIAKCYRNRGLDFIDLIGEGNVGLMTAVEKFDLEKGTKFSTHATWWIKNEIKSAIANLRSTVRIPVGVGRLVATVSRMSRALEQRLGRKPTPQELEDHIKPTMMHDQYESASHGRKAREIGSLDALKSKRAEDSAPVAAFVVGKRASNPWFRLDREIEVEKAQSAIAELMAYLDVIKDQDRDVGIFKRYYGLCFSPLWVPQTMTDIGLEFGVSRERIRQICKNFWDRLEALECAIQNAAMLGKSLTTVGRIIDMRDVGSVSFIEPVRLSAEQKTKLRQFLIDEGLVKAMKVRRPRETKKKGR